MEKNSDSSESNPSRDAHKECRMRVQAVENLGTLVMARLDDLYEMSPEVRERIGTVVKDYAATRIESHGIDRAVSDASVNVFVDMMEQVFSEDLDGVSESSKTSSKQHRRPSPPLGDNHMSIPLNSPGGQPEPIHRPSALSQNTWGSAPALLEYSACAKYYQAPKNVFKLERSRSMFAINDMMKQNNINPFTTVHEHMQDTFSRKYECSAQLVSPDESEKESCIVKYEITARSHLQIIQGTTVVFQAERSQLDFAENIDEMKIAFTYRKQDERQVWMMLQFNEDNKSKYLKILSELLEDCSFE